MQHLTSYIMGKWVQGEGEGRKIHHALTNETLYTVTTEGLPLAESLQYGRQVGGEILSAMTFQQRGQMLKALAKYLLEHKAQLYAISAQTGATKADSWVDIEGELPHYFLIRGSLTVSYRMTLFGQKMK